MRLEVLRWYRSKSFVVAFIICAMSGIIAPLSAYFADEILKQFGGDSAKIIMSAPTWPVVLLAYFKNVEQLVLFILVFLVASKCYLGKNKSLALFYTTRAQSAGQIFMPRVMMGVAVTAVSMAIGGACAFYMVYVLFDGKIDVGNALALLALNMVVIVALVIVGAVIGIWWSSPFLSAITIEVLVLVAGILNGTNGFKSWSPTLLLMPRNLVNHAIDPYFVVRMGIVLVVIMLLAVASIKFKPLRQKLT